MVRKDSDRLIVEPVRRRPDLATLLVGWEPLDEIWLELEQVGSPIGPNDLRIAAHALESGLTLVTDSAEEFGQVAGFQIENSLDSPAPAP